MDIQTLKNILEAAMLATGQPTSMEKFQSLFMLDEQPTHEEFQEALAALQADYADRGIEMVEVGSGWRLQVKQSYAPWIGRLWEERAPRYSRALLETLALIAYRQPITRGEIEDIRGVSVSTTIIKTLTDREWVRVVGHRDVPGRPAMYATTREFLDYFCLKNLDDLPTLAELRDIDSINAELDLGMDTSVDVDDQATDHAAANDDAADGGADATQAAEAEIDAIVEPDAAHEDDYVDSRDEGGTTDADFEDALNDTGNESEGDEPEAAMVTDMDDADGAAR